MVNILVDAVTNSQRGEYTTNVPSNPTYTRYITNRNGTTYLHENWFNVQPPPCVFINQALNIWNKPNLAYIGDLMEQDMDIYMEPKANQWWFIEGNTIPFGIATSSYGSYQISNYMPTRPPMSAFQVPNLCFPAFGSNMTRLTPIGAVPIVPSQFVLYAVRSAAPFPLTVYYDGMHGNIRIDNGVASLLQIGNDVYTFSSEINSRIMPTPCQHTVQTTPLFQLPVFSRRVANVTIDDFPTSVWVAYNPLDMVATYWYFDVNNLPLMYTSIYGAIKINFFGTLAPPPSIFTVPPQCQIKAVMTQSS